MPILQPYTELMLAQYMERMGGDVSTTLGWTASSGSFDEPIVDVLLEYGVEDIADATDLKKLRGLARVMFWRAVLRSASARYDFSADGGSYSRSQLHAMAKEMLAMAEADASEYLSTYQVEATGIGYKEGYYQDYDEEMTEW